MPDHRNRVLVTLDEETFDMLQDIKAATGISPSATINKMLGAQIFDLAQYAQWLRDIDSDKRPVLKRTAADVLQSFGPDTLVDGIKRADPSYETLDDRQRAMMTKSK